MIPWVTIFISLYGLTEGQEFPSKHQIVKECCEDGRDYGLRWRHCVHLPKIASSSACSIAQEQCCIAAVQDVACVNGITQAKEMGVCEVLSYGDYYSNRTAEVESLHCELNISVTNLCQDVANSCFGGTAPTVNGGDADKTKLCAAMRCSQVCLNSGTCACHEGYRLQTDGRSCEDINECSVGGHDCPEGELCINTEGSFHCQRQANCDRGYKITDTNECQDIDECSLGTHDCGSELRCQNTPGSFQCQCASTLPQISLSLFCTSSDVNECASESRPCLSGESCINTVGSYICLKTGVSCRQGFQLSNDSDHCIDINECEESKGICEGHGCVNLPGSFRCECRPGFFYDSRSRVCRDFDECRAYSSQLCAHKCENLPGSYKCRCHSGFRLANDGRNCKDVDECALSAIRQLCSYQCLNTPGSFKCTCPATGYILAPDRLTCQDVDECVSGTHTCAVGQSCFNIQGSFRCLSFECPRNFHRAAEHRCERMPCERASDCLSQPLQISFYNLTFPASIPIPADILRMGPSSSVPGDVVNLSIAAGNDEGFFSVHRLSHGGVIVLRKPLTKAHDFLLTVEMRLMRYSTVSLFVAKIAVFVTNEKLISANSRIPH
ncbi:fibulin-1-like [Chanos chanos]|uniref:Fibulin-1-like n=1 Tax=Chanos chanos TaxID=29144 RepID=A0A6J2VI72_CHACN|nr:fibulin-1-like [Chanos chanos]